MSGAARLRELGRRAAARGGELSSVRLALLAAVILATGTAGVVAAVPVATTSFQAGVTSATGQAALVSLPAYGARGTDVLDYRDHAAVVLRVPLRNTGRFAVTVTDVTLDGARFELLKVVSGPAAFRLAPGATRLVELHAQLGNCRYYHEREVRTYDGVVVSFTTTTGGGRRHVPLLRPITVHSPMIIGCADRKLDRSAVNRRDG